MITLGVIGVFVLLALLWGLLIWAVKQEEYELEYRQQQRLQRAADAHTAGKARRGRTAREEWRERMGR